MEPIVVFFTLSATVFGIAYVFLTTRNKERLALIEKGMDASLFNHKKNKPTVSKLVLNIALLLMGIGLGIFMGAFMHNATGISDDITIPSMLFIFGGLGLGTGFFVTRKLEANEKSES